MEGGQIIILVVAGGWMLFLSVQLQRFKARNEKLKGANESRDEQWRQIVIQREEDTARVLAGSKVTLEQYQRKLDTLTRRNTDLEDERTRRNALIDMLNKELRFYKDRANQ